MVTSTPPDLSGSSNPNGSGGFQPAQLFGGSGGSASNLHQQVQMLMAQQQQQQRGTPNLQQFFVNNIRQFLLYSQGLQQARQQQEHNNSMLNSPVPPEFGLLSAFHQNTSTPLPHSDTSSSPSQLFFLSPQTPASTNQQGLNPTASSQQADGNFQMPLGVLNNAQIGGQAKPPQRRRNRQGGPTVKTAEVWRFFKQKPPPEQAAVCDICQKTIKATNSSTTGMIRHLKSCHREQHEILEKARYQANIFKTLSSCTDDESRETLLKAFSAGPNYLAQPLSHSATTTTRHDSSTNSSVSPNSTASSSAVDTSSRTQLLLQNSSGIHSIESLLDSSADLEASNLMENNSAPPPAVFTSPTKYMVKVKSDLTRVEHEAKNAMESRSENLNVEEEDDENEDVENLAVTEEDSEEDASLVSNPKRQRLDEDANKNSHRHFQRQKPTKQHAQAENIEKNIALMLLLDDLPTDIVDQPGFRHLIANLVPTYPLPSAADFKSKILPHLKSQLPNGDVALLRQRFLENNRFSPGHSATQTHTVHWPISPSTTCESGFDEILDALSETASSASMHHIVEQSVRSAQNISQSFGFSTPLNNYHQQSQNAKNFQAKKLKNLIAEKEMNQKEGEVTRVKIEEVSHPTQELATSTFLDPKRE